MKKILIEKTNDDIGVSPWLAVKATLPDLRRGFLADLWNLLNEVEHIGPNGLAARVSVPRDSIWFKGHFPGEPILPGISLVNSVYEIILRDARDRGESVRISSLKRVKFMGPVRPGDNLSFSLIREDAKGEEPLFHFKVTVDENVICSGLVAVTKKV